MSHVSKYVGIDIGRQEVREVVRRRSSDLNSIYDGAIFCLRSSSRHSQSLGAIVSLIGRANSTRVSWSARDLKFGGVNGGSGMTGNWTTEATR
jgi:hypothetical protein